MIPSSVSTGQAINNSGGVQQAELLSDIQVKLSCRPPSSTSASFSSSPSSSSSSLIAWQNSLASLIRRVDKNSLTLQDKKDIDKASLSILSEQSAALLTEHGMQSLAVSLVCDNALTLDQLADWVCTTNKTDKTIAASLRTALQLRATLRQGRVEEDLPQWTEELLLEYPTVVKLRDMSYERLAKLTMNHQLFHQSNRDEALVASLLAVWSEGNNIRTAVLEHQLPGEYADKMMYVLRLSNVGNLTQEQTTQLIQDARSDKVKAAINNLYEAKSKQAKEKAAEDSIRHAKWKEDTEAASVLLTQAEDALKNVKTEAGDYDEVSKEAKQTFESKVRAAKAKLGLTEQSYQLTPMDKLDVKAANTQLEQLQADVFKVLTRPAQVSDVGARFSSLSTSSVPCSSSSSADLSLRSPNVSDEGLTAGLSGGLATYACSFGDSLDTLGHLAPEPLIDRPVFCPMLGARMTQFSNESTFQSQSSFESYKKASESVGSSIAASISASGWGFSVKASHSRSNKGSTSSMQKLESQTTHSVAVRMSVIAKQSFRISRSQMRLSADALSAAAQVTSYHTAIDFMQRYGTHISSGVQHVGGIFWQRVVVTTKTAQSSRDMMSLAQSELQTAMGAGGAGFGFGAGLSFKQSQGKTKETGEGSQARSFDASASATVLCTGPWAADVDMFNQLLDRQPGQWRIIDRGQQRSLVAVWELLKDHALRDSTSAPVTSSIFFAAAQHIRAAWLQRARQIAPVVEQVSCEVQRTTLYELQSQNTILGPENGDNPSRLLPSIAEQEKAAMEKKQQEAVDTLKGDVVMMVNNAPPPQSISASTPALLNIFAHIIRSSYQHNLDLLRGLLMTFANERESEFLKYLQRIVEAEYDTSVRSSSMTPKEVLRRLLADHRDMLRDLVVECQKQDAALPQSLYDLFMEKEWTSIAAANTLFVPPRVRQLHQLPQLLSQARESFSRAAEAAEDWSLLTHRVHSILRANFHKTWMEVQMSSSSAVVLPVGSSTSSSPSSSFSSSSCSASPLVASSHPSSRPPSPPSSASMGVEWTRENELLLPPLLSVAREFGYTDDGFHSDLHSEGLNALLKSLEGVIQRADEARDQRLQPDIVGPQVLTNQQQPASSGLTTDADWSAGLPDRPRGSEPHLRWLMSATSRGYAAYNTILVDRSPTLSAAHPLHLLLDTLKHRQPLDGLVSKLRSLLITNLNAVTGSVPSQSASPVAGATSGAAHSAPTAAPPSQFRSRVLRPDANATAQPTTAGEPAKLPSTLDLVVEALATMDLTGQTEIARLLLDRRAAVPIVASLAYKDTVGPYHAATEFVLRRLSTLNTSSSRSSQSCSSSSVSTTQSFYSSFPFIKLHRNTVLASHQSGGPWSVPLMMDVGYWPAACLGSTNETQQRSFVYGSSVFTFHSSPQAQWVERSLDKQVEIARYFQLLPSDNHLSLLPTKQQLLFLPAIEAAQLDTAEQDVEWYDNESCPVVLLLSTLKNKRDSKLAALLKGVFNVHSVHLVDQRNVPLMDEEQGQLTNSDLIVELSRASVITGSAQPVDCSVLHVIGDCSSDLAKPVIQLLADRCQVCIMEWDGMDESVLNAVQDQQYRINWNSCARNSDLNPTHYNRAEQVMHVWGDADWVTSQLLQVCRDAKYGVQESLHKSAANMSLHHLCLALQQSGLIKEGAGDTSFVVVDKSLSMLDWRLVRGSLVLQSSFAEEAALFIKRTKAARDNDQVAQATLKLQIEEREKFRRQQAGVVEQLPLITQFIGILRQPNSVHRMLAIQQLDKQVNSCIRAALKPLLVERMRVQAQYEAEGWKDEQLRRRLQSSQDGINRAWVGLEILWRELSHLYVAYPQRYHDFPQLAAQHMLDGFALELMDGDASHINTTWVSAVIKAIKPLLPPVVDRHGRPRESTVFVLSFVGPQSTGKSTLCNTLFGTRMRTSSGQTTRGVNMQLIRASGRASYDYVLLLDTEGLEAPEHRGLEGSHARDNRMASMGMLPADATLILSTESTSVMQDALPVVFTVSLESGLAADNDNRMRSRMFILFPKQDLKQAGKLKNMAVKLLDSLDQAFKIAQKMRALTLTKQPVTTDGTINTPASVTHTAQYADLFRAVGQIRVNLDKPLASDISVLGALRDEDNGTYTKAWGQNCVDYREYVEQRLHEPDDSGRIFTARTLDKFRGELIHDVWPAILSTSYSQEFSTTWQRANHDIARLFIADQLRQLVNHFAICFHELGNTIRQAQAKSITANSGQATSPSSSNSKSTSAEQLKREYCSDFDHSIVQRKSELRGRVAKELGREEYSNIKLDIRTSWDERVQHELSTYHHLIKEMIDSLFDYDTIVLEYEAQLTQRIKEEYKTYQNQGKDSWDARVKELLDAVAGEANHYHPPLSLTVQNKIDNVYRDTMSEAHQYVQSCQPSDREQLVSCWTDGHHRPHVRTDFDLLVNELSAKMDQFTKVSLTSTSKAMEVATSFVRAFGFGGKQDFYDTVSTQDKHVLVDLLRCLYKDVLEPCKSYSRDVVIQGIELASTKLMPQTLRLRRHGHVMAYSLLAAHLKCVQTLWDTNHSVGKRLTAPEQQQRFFSFSTALFTGLTSGELLAAEVLAAFVPVYLASFRRELMQHILLEFANSPRLWFIDGSLVLNHVDNDLLQLLDSNKVDDVLELLDQPAKHYHDLLLTLIGYVVNKCAVKRWEAFTKAVRSSFITAGSTAALIMTSELLPAKEFLNQLRVELASAVAKSDLHQKVPVYSKPSHGECNVLKGDQWTLIANNIVQGLPSLFPAHDYSGLRNETAQAVLAALRDLHRVSDAIRPRCPAACPLCSSRCTSAEHHELQHTTVHQMQGLTGWYYTGSDALVGKTCYEKCTFQPDTRFHMPGQRDVLRKYGEFGKADGVFPEWARPASDVRLELREYIFHRYHEHIMQYHGLQHTTDEMRAPQSLEVIRAAIRKAVDPDLEDAVQELSFSPAAIHTTHQHWLAKNQALQHNITADNIKRQPADKTMDPSTLSTPAIVAQLAGGTGSSVPMPATSSSADGAVSDQVGTLSGCRSVKQAPIDNGSAPPADPLTPLSAPAPVSSTSSVFSSQTLSPPGLPAALPQWETHEQRLDRRLASLIPPRVRYDAGGGGDCLFHSVVDQCKQEGISTLNGAVTDSELLYRLLPLSDIDIAATRDDEQDWQEWFRSTTSNSSSSSSSTSSHARRLPAIPLTFSTVRSLCISWLRLNGDIRSGSEPLARLLLAAHASERDGAMFEVTERDSSEEVDTKWQLLVSLYAPNGEWGDHIFFPALTELLCRRIDVVSSYVLKAEQERDQTQWTRTQTPLRPLVKVQAEQRPKFVIAHSYGKHYESGRLLVMRDSTLTKKLNAVDDQVAQ